MFGNIEKTSVSKNNSFHFIRLLCCLCIIYEHSVFLSSKRLPVLEISSICVKVFFILSGFWVTISFLRSESVKEYAVKRIKKILPPYFTVVIAFALLLCVVSTLSPGKYFTNTGFWKYLAANLTTLNFLHTSLPGVFEGLPLNGAVNGALWTIKVEIAFYMFLPFLMLVMTKCKYKYIRGGVLISMYFISVLYILLCHAASSVKPALSPLENQFPAFMGYFASGMAFALFWEDLQKSLNYAIVPSLVVFIICHQIDNYILYALIFPIVLSCLVFWIATRLSFLGKIVTKDYSFGMYLVHYPLVMLFVQQGFFASCWPLAFAGVLGLSFTASYLLGKIKL